ncbi:MAG: hypothetical protein IKX23_03120 [Treponema sp.]|nr:hypothetical protein [Treponema sp.]
MTEEEKHELFEEINELTDICNEYCPLTQSSSLVVEAVKPAVTEMIKFIVKDKNEIEKLLQFLETSDFYTAPASTKFHGDFKGGLACHTFMVIRQSLIFAQPMLSNFFTSPEAENYTVTAKDIFLCALCHDFCKTNFYEIEYRNAKDLNGNWIKKPFYKTKSESRNLGHGNESVLIMLKIMPSLIDNRPVLEAVSRHMGFSDLSESESYNYSVILQNPLVLLLQTADQTAAQWFNF